MLSVLAVVLGLTVLAGAGPVGAASPAAVSAWKSIPGTQKTKDRPAAVTYGGRTWVFVRGTDDRLHYTRRTASGWAPWARLGSSFAIADAPAVVTFKKRINVIVRRDSDGHVLRRTFDGTRWSSWSDITFTDGTTVAGPGAAVSGGKLLVAIRRADSTIWLIEHSGTAWGAWGEMAGEGLTDMTPAVTDTDSGPLVVVSGYADDYAWDNQAVDGTFGVWVPQDLVYTKDPVAVARWLNVVYQIIRDLDGKIQFRMRGLDWSALSDMGVTSASGPGVTRTGSGVLVVIRNANNKVSWSTITPEG